MWGGGFPLPCRLLTCGGGVHYRVGYSRVGGVYYCVCYSHGGVSITV